MDRMLVVIFDNEAKAYEGKKVLTQLDDEGSLGVYGYAVLAKNPDGAVTIKQGDDVGPMGTLVGTSLGSLIGVLGGPVGMAIGATAGLVGGSFLDLDNLRIGGDYLDDVSKALTPGKSAVVAQVEQAWTTPVDARLAAIGGTVYRRALSDVTDKVNQEELDAMKADLAQYKAEVAKERADRQAKIQSKIKQLEARIEARQQQIQDRRKAIERQAEAKAELLRRKAEAKAHL